MPKDPTENIARYKIRGGHMNEYEFHKNQEAFAEMHRERSKNLIPGTPPEKIAAPVEKLEQKQKKTTKPKNTGSQQAGPKLAAKKSSQKKSTNKSTSKKSSAKKRTR